MLLSRELEKYKGVEVTRTSNLVQSLALLDTHTRFGLVLLDLKLTDGSGFEILKYIRNKPPNKRSPVVVLSTSNSQDDIDLAYKLYANAYVQKPQFGTHFKTLASALVNFWKQTNQALDCIQ
jgi:CheY-like chemotaxis protein